jgi:Lactoylglutathione lyase and related lyases
MLRVLHHVCIETDCYEKSLRFYRDVLGFAVVDETRDFHGREYNTWLKNVDIMIELQTPKKKSGPRFLLRFLAQSPFGINHICFLVDDIEKEVARIEGHGGSSFKKKDGSSIYRVSGVPLCKIVAPEGTVIELREQDICF